MPASEFADWQAYFQVEPWGTHAAEVLIAKICELLYASSGAKPPTMDKLMPFYSTMQDVINRDKRKSAEQMLADARAAMAGSGIKVVRNV